VVTFNLAELFESVAAAVPDRTAMVTPDRRLTYGELDERATRLGQHLRAAGVGASDHVGLHLQNGSEYIEGMLAAFKLRAVPVNINYRYVERELEHLYVSLDLVALLVHRRFASTAAAVAPRVASLRHVIVVDDDSDAASPAEWVEYESALAAASSAREFAGRGDDDVYCACTGGTTGLPKGVLWRHEDIFFASMGGGDPTLLLGPIKTPEELVERLPENGLVGLVTPPFMHVSAHWAAFNLLYGGGRMVIPEPGSLDPSEVWRLVAEEGINLLVLVGDAMARPLLDHLAEHPSDTSSLFAVASGGAILSPATKRWINELLPNAIVVDGFGSTETGVTGSGSGGDTAGAGTTFRMDDTTAVLDDDLQPVAPGSGDVGRLARRGRIPLGYYNDAEKTAATFIEKDGVRWVLPGDMASVADDGTIVMHGRGSVSINTGGEKVFPEEVESAIVGHPAVHDVLVVGVPDERWGQRVAAVVAVKEGASLTLDELRDYCRNEVAGYKVPRQLTVVSSVVRSPSGKADYRWAKEAAMADVADAGAERG
jgi:acyl-CoA synthetase (AMP-forming)/AMP-acid ligase II